MAGTSVVIVAYGDEPELGDCLASVAHQLGADGEIILVDNGADRIDQRVAPFGDVVTVIRPTHNIGFAAGANAGAAEANGSVLVFVNSDLVLQNGALERLRSVVQADGTAIATGCLRLRRDPSLINSAGNPVHFTGIAWAGGFDEPAERYGARRFVASASGGFMAVSRERWLDLGGFNPDYFMYHEDVELSLRQWMTGGRVVFVPEATAVHDYAFGRNPRKMYQLERNRLVTVITVFPASLLMRVLPALIIMELGLLALALLQGWAGEKLRSYWWLMRNAASLRRRRRQVQGSFTEPPDVLGALLASRIDPAGFGPVPGLGVLNAGLAAYWRAAWPAHLRRSSPFA